MQEEYQDRKREEKELCLKPWSFAYVLDKTSGMIKTFVGPVAYTMTPNDVPVVFDQGGFQEVRFLDDAIRDIPVVPENFYLSVLNPAVNGQQPATGRPSAEIPELEVGRRIIIPGPVEFPPWPGQMTQVIRGHHLRFNEYLLVKVYNEEEARQSWGKAVIRAASGDSEDGTGDDDDATSVVSSDAPDDLAVGKHYLIRGDQVSFYMPPTGVSVVSVDRNLADNSPRKFVRQALTLEVLEYAILVDEDGNKRYERGPNVVFPLPTEKFVEKDGKTKFDAIELNEIQGLHIKVIEAYTDENGKEHKEGDELFITGKETAIYYPREEHSAVSYDGKAKHFATAIPAGEGRYVMNRITGEIKRVEGPDMLLPDPRTEVIVRRVLTDGQCDLWYPGNLAAREHNQLLRSIAATAPTTRSGAVSDGDYTRSTRGKKKAAGMEASQVSRNQRAMMTEEFSRASTYTQPRTVTLDTKFQGVPRVDVWTGYAVLVVSPSGQRRVERGPTTILLDYDETLEPMALSTGKPKTTDHLLKTVFLRVRNNTVTDYVNDIETSDHVKLNVKLVYKVDFEGDPTQWWDIENYVKHLTDHVRSVVKGAVKKLPIEEFYANPIDMIRDTILGAKVEGQPRPGMPFENGMRIKDVEVLRVKLQNTAIQELLDDAQHQVVETNIALARARRDLEVTREQQGINRQKAQELQDTKVFQQDLTESLRVINHEGRLAEAAREQESTERLNANDLTNAEARLLVTLKDTESNAAVHRFKLTQEQDKQAMEEARLVAQTNAVIARVESMSPQLEHAIRSFQEVIRLKSLTDGFGELAVIDSKGVAEKAREVFDLLPQNLRVHLGTGSNGQLPKLDA
jgi:major vault protein